MQQLKEHEQLTLMKSECIMQGVQGTKDQGRNLLLAPFLRIVCIICMIFIY